MASRRKQCLNCKHADVIRYLHKPEPFPMGVFCGLEEVPPGGDPRDAIHCTDDKCHKWEGKTKEGRNNG